MGINLSKVGADDVGGGIDDCSGIEKNHVNKTTNNKDINDGLASSNIVDGAVMDSSSPGSLSFLLKETHFTMAELKQYHRIFYRDCPNGLLTREDFIRIYERFFPFGDCTTYSLLHYRAMDLDLDGKITFSDYIRTLSIWSRGTVEERSNFIHRAMDIDSNSLITNNDLREWVIGSLEMIGDFGCKYAPLTDGMVTFYGKQKLCIDAFDKDFDEDFDEATTPIAAKPPSTATDDVIEIYIMDIIANCFKSDEDKISLSKGDLLRIVQANPEVLRALLVFDGRL